MVISQHCTEGLFVGILEHDPDSGKLQIREFIPYKGKSFGDETILVFNLQTGEGWKLDDFVKILVVRSTNRGASFRVTQLISSCGVYRKISLSDYSHVKFIKHKPRV